MNPDPENFDSLRQLLALKRHEIPPPGFFEGFAGEVNARIRAGEAIKHGGVAQRMAAEAPWLFKFFEIFEAKPAFVGGFATALCLLLGFGIVMAERPDVASSAPSLFADATSSANQIMSPNPSVPDKAAAQPASMPLLAMNTNSSLQPLGSPVFGSQEEFFQRASYSIPGN
jgi:hypothetical protein